MGYWLDDDWDVGFNLWATPPNNATTAKSVDIVAVYDVGQGAGGWGSQGWPLGTGYCFFVLKDFPLAGPGR